MQDGKQSFSITRRTFMVVFDPFADFVLNSLTKYIL